ncbi:acyl carrier protein [Pleionea sp. CnH1-48]|uniref:acyl carrier protein n=1 Tax=Pleionea sp. CnH1-48 TaxID=2954494 RepID=UPI002096E7CB|nr:phosphopantetheine-binding protein [Pleionea sp. CnH1-48]MCO7226241.1 phosphopantetheine-binding protein [Pleionea sp. CnH1-48]
MASTALVETIIQLVVEILSLDDKVELNEDTLLLGSIPEFDSMSIVSVISAIEETWQIAIPDDELSAEVFESIGSLANFVEQLKTSA